MKKTILNLLIVIALIISIGISVLPVQADTSSIYLAEYLNTGADSDSQPTYGNNITYQSFTVGALSHTVVYFNLWLKKYGSPSGTINAKLYYADATNKPTGNVIVSSSTVLDASSLSTSYVKYQFNITETGIQHAQLYAIVLSLTGGDSSNYVLWQAVSGGGGLTGAKAGYSVDGGTTWAVNAAANNYFEVWGNPSLQVIGANIFQNYQTTGDWLICAEVQNTFAPYYPKSDPQLYFSVQLINGSTVVASTAQKEFGRRPIAILISPATAGTLTWGSANIKVRVQLNGVVGTYAEYALTSTDWQSGGNLYVDNWVRFIASDMQTYDISTGVLASTGAYTVQSNAGKLLNAAGGQIFITGIPLIQSIRPALFQYTSTAIVPTASTATDTWTGAAIHDWTTNIGASNAAFMTSVANFFGIPSGRDLIAFIFYAMWLIGGALLLGKGHSTSALAVGLPIIAAGTYSGFIDIQPLVIAACFAAFALVKAIFFDKAG